MYKVLFTVTRTVLPRKTPISDEKYKKECFWRETDTIEEVLKIMDKINKLSKEDILLSNLIIDKDSNKIILLLKDSTKEIIIKEYYTIPYQSMMRHLQNTGELDFTFVDEEWINLLKKYQML